MKNLLEEYLRSKDIISNGIVLSDSIREASPDILFPDDYSTKIISVGDTEEYCDREVEYYHKGAIVAIELTEDYYFYEDHHIWFRFTDYGTQLMNGYAKDWFEDLLNNS